MRRDDESPLLPELPSEPPDEPPDERDERDELEHLREQLRAERRVAEMSRSFLALELDQLGNAVRAALGATAGGVGADRAQLTWLRRDRDGSPILDRYSWAAPGIEPIRTGFAASAFPWLIERLRAGEIVNAARISDLPDAAAVERQELLAHGNRSYLALPIVWQQQLKGSLDVRSVRAERCWSPVEIERLQLLGEVLASVLWRQQVDADRRENADRFREELELRLQLERLVSDLSRRLLSSGATEIDPVIASGLESIARESAADRAFFLSVPELRHDRPYFFEWCSDAVPVRNTPPAGPERDRFRGFAARLLAGETIRVPVVAALPDELSVEREAMLADGIQSYLLVPAVSRGKLVGILGVHCVREPRDFPDHEVTLLQVVADLFRSALRRKRNETALAESEARFRALAENSQDSICELAADGRILYASPAFAGLVGSEQRELEQRTLVELAHPDDRPLVRERLAAAGPEATAAATVFRTSHREGRWLDLELTARSFRAALGEERLVIVLRDVSRRERDRRALEQQVAGEQQIAELSRFFLDLEPGATRAAIGEKLPVAAALAGAERSWMVTRDPRGTEPLRRYDWSLDGSALAPWHLPESIDAFPWAKSGLHQGLEIHMPRLTEVPEAAAAERDVLLARGVRSFLGVPLLSGRRMIGMMGFEVSSQEREWSPESITLLRLVGEIFASALRREQSEIQLEQSQSQLLQSQKMEAVGTLAGGIAHDFNNHLAVMLGNARFLASLPEHDDVEVRDALGDLQRSAEHCAQLTRSLLAFSRRSPVEVQRIEVGAVMEAVCDLVRPLLPSAIALEVESADPADAVQADPTQLRQVLINLLVNARDAMPEGGRVRLSSRRRSLASADARALGLDAAGSYVELVVRDDGHGIPPKIRPRIFEPFFTTKRVGEGTGLGLATAYGIIQQCRGAITVESAPGHGATFRVLLPIAEGAARSGEPERADGPGAGSETLLLVDDEPAIRRLLCRVLRRSGYHVVEAPDGIEALAEFERVGDGIDVLVTDLAMPRLGGVELARKLHAQWPELPVLFLSGHGEPDVPSAAAIRGARFLQKPFDESALLREVRRLLDSPEPD